MNYSVGFIGLGNLGGAMARRLRAQKIELVVWNRTRARAEAFAAEAGVLAKIATSPVDLARQCDVIVLNLFDTPAVRDVIAGVDGLFETDCRKKIVIDTTTNHAAQVLPFYGLVADAGGVYLEAPVLGSVVPASQGKLTMLVSGDKSAFETVRPLMERLTGTIFYLEQPGLATKIKLINNLVLAGFMATIAEAISIGDAAGIERGKLLEILGAGAGNSGVLNAKKQKLIDSDFSPHFSVGAIHKDLEYLKQLTAELKQDQVMAQAARQLFAAAEKSGLRDEDLSAVIKIVENRLRK
jgi:3-hydroxyisobutyrate dehydrogenase